MDEVREMACEFNEGLKSIFTEWSTECEVNFSYSYTWQSKKSVITIYAKLPGVLIGLRGETVNKYRDKLAKYLVRNPDTVKISFVIIDDTVIGR